MREYIANLHVHTTFSDGHEPIQAVIDAARKAGLDILLITDHDTVEGKKRGYEGYHGDLLVLIGSEISGPHHHYLVFGLDEAPPYRWNEPQEFIDRVKAAGGVGFMAHPFEKGTPMSDNGHAFTWLNWDVDGFDGMEIWNHASCWKKKAVNHLTAIYYYFTRTKTLEGPEAETLGKWDELGLSRPVAGVAGSDVHAFPAKLGPLRFSIFPLRIRFYFPEYPSAVERTPLGRPGYRPGACPEGLGRRAFLHGS